MGSHGTGRTGYVCAFRVHDCAASQSAWCQSGQQVSKITFCSFLVYVVVRKGLNSVCDAWRNEQYYEAILSIWNQLYINVKSLIAWQYCLLDIRRINSLTITTVSDESTDWGLSSLITVISKKCHTQYICFHALVRGCSCSLPSLFVIVTGHDRLYI